MKMRIYKILNNNVAVILDENQQEKVVMGRGICYKKKVGEEIDEKSIDKEFALSTTEANNKFQVLIKDIPLEHMEIGEQVITEAKERLGKNLNEMIYISLIDHIHTAIVRFLDGIIVKNVLLWDIRRFYKEEFQIGLWAIDFIEQKLKIRLSEDEAGFIALHIANAEMDSEKMHNMYEITTIMQEIVNLVKYFFQTDFDEDNVYYYRFITHLKFFAKRLVDKTTYEDDDSDDLLEVIRVKYEKAYQCVQKIAQFILKKYEYALSKEEYLYLTIHIERVIHKMKECSEKS